MSAPHTRSPTDFTIMFEHCSQHSSYIDPGSPSGRSSPSNSSPSTPIEPYPQSPIDLSVSSEDSWNLIPYDVPWGSEYYHYHAGTLPGPDGACIFLRSPTPLKNRRTQKACNKCRQRKAKVCRCHPDTTRTTLTPRAPLQCSGTRPACSRCLARGYICEYVEEEPKRPSQSSATPATRPRPRARAQREPSECSDGAGSDSESSSYNYVHPKSEDSEPSTPELLHPSRDGSSLASTASPTQFASQWEDAHHQYSMAASYGFDAPATEHYAADAAAMHEYYDPSSYHLPDDIHACAPQDVSPVYASSVHAPRPVRCGGSPPSFLTPEERLGAFQGMGVGVAMQQNPMLLEPAAQIAIPQVPAMPPTAAGEPAALVNGAVE